MGYWGWPELDCTPDLAYEPYSAASPYLVAEAEDHTPTSLPFGFTKQAADDTALPPSIPERDAWMWW
jgi:hypothetical protein